ncbi:MAG: succinyl-CoA synthetase subunit alpha [Candidatus Nanohalarchaeota archaeon]|nr:MAG: succinyl-CoA synthetase subunit alpha [Candidatus Nanohaloarchaeota archaeon]
MATKEFNWFVDADLRKYKGEYVAIIDEKVVAHGDNAKDVWEDAKRKYPDKSPSLAKIPKDDILIL